MTGTLRRTVGPVARHTLARFAVAGGIGFALVWLGVPYLIGKVLVSGVVAVVTYVGSRWWVFRGSVAEQPEPEPAAIVP